MHNTIRYLCGLKIFKPLIIIYYVLTLLACVYKCVLFVIFIVHTPHTYETEFLKQNDFWDVMPNLAVFLSLTPAILHYLTI